MRYCRRTLEAAIQEASATFPVVLVTGPRQSGKTTVLRHLASGEERGYVTLDELGPRRLAREDPALFFQEYPPPVLVDEIQHAPELLRQVKVLVDREPSRCGTVWMTGSQHFPLMQGVSESLAGRVAILRLLGLSGAEEAGVGAEAAPFRPDRIGGDVEPWTLGPLFDRIVRGSLPRLSHPDAPRTSMFWSSYLQTYVERDVRALTEVRRLPEFERFLRLVAARTAQLINYSDLARDAGIAVSTAREWLALLEAGFQVLLLRPYHANLAKREVKTPKLYVLDTGLVASLAGWTSGDVARRGAMAGPLFETWVVGEVVRSWWHRGLDAPIWFWRTRHGVEVDLLIEQEGQLFPVEIKLAAEPGRRALRGIDRLRAAGGERIGPGAVVCLVGKDYPIDRLTRAVNAASIV